MERALFLIKMNQTCLLVDFSDSFFFNIKEVLTQQLGLKAICIKGEDKESIPEVYKRNQCDFLMLGPGPGHIDDYSFSEELWHFIETIPTLGVCLGHQFLCARLGVRPINLERPLHGKSLELDELGQLLGVEKLRGQFYNSWAPNGSMPHAESVSKYQGNIIYFHHKNWIGVQFHPESVGTTFPKEVFNALLGKIV